MTFVSRLPDDRCPNENGMLISSAMWNVRDVEPSVVQNPHLACLRWCSLYGRISA